MVEWVLMGKGEMWRDATEKVRYIVRLVVTGGKDEVRLVY